MPTRGPHRSRARRAVWAFLTLAWTAAPAMAVEPPSTRPTVERRTLASGLRLVVERRPGARVAIEVVWPGARGADTADDAGADAVVAAAIGLGCGEEAASAGGGLAATVGRRGLAVRGSWPVEAWREGLATAWSCPRSPAVAARLVTARERLAAEDAVLADSPGRRAAAVAAARRWPGHPLGAAPHPPLAGLTAAALRARHDAQLAVAPVVAVVGDVAIDELAAALAGATGTPPAAAPSPAPPPPPAVRQVFVETAGERAALALALPAPGPAAEGRAAFEVLAALLAEPGGPLAEAAAAGTLDVALLDADGASGLVLAVTAPGPTAPRVEALTRALAELAGRGPDPIAVAAVRARLLDEHARPARRAADLAAATLTGAPDPALALAAVEPAGVARAAASLRWDQGVLATAAAADHTPAVDRRMHDRPRGHRGLRPARVTPTRTPPRSAPPRHPGARRHRGRRR